MELRVLAIDDDENVLKAHRRVLRAAGFTVDVAHSGEEALRLLDAQAYAVVLLDLRMPEMDGITLLRLLREREDVVPVVLVTGSLTADSAALAINLGVSHCLTKPLNARELTAGVTGVVRTHQPTPTIH
jgi:DNA-binding response OmpR family regulator